MQQRNAVKHSQRLLGGTPFAEVSINQNEVDQRRTGWRKVVRTLKAGPNPPTLVIKASPLSALSFKRDPSHQRGLDLLWPTRTSIVNYDALKYLELFSWLKYPGASGAHGAGRPVKCASVRLVVDILENVHAFNALQGAWEPIHKRLPTGDRRNCKVMRDEFRQCVMRFWPAFHTSDITSKRSTMTSDESANYFRNLGRGNQGIEDDESSQLFAPFHIKETALAAPMQLVAGPKTTPISESRHSTPDDSDDDRADSRDRKSPGKAKKKSKSPSKSPTRKSRKSSHKSKRGERQRERDDTDERSDGSDSGSD